MKQTVTLEIENMAVLQLIKSLAEVSLVKFAKNLPTNEDLIIAQINEVCKEVDTSMDPALYSAQMEVLNRDGSDW